MLLFSNCWRNADRDNPLDPKSPLFRNTGIVSGTVLSYYAPNQPLSQATIILLPNFRSVFTDENGKYRLSDVPAGSYTLLVQKTNYSSDSAKIEVTAGQEIVRDFNLDALPLFVNPNVHSIHISRWFPQPYDQFYLNVEVKVIDADGANDIDSVFLLNANLRVIDTLKYQPQNDLYQSLQDLTDRPLLGNLVGKPMYIKAIDKAGFFSISQEVFLHRVISQTPTLISPISLALVGNRPKLVWADANVNFTHTFEVNVFRADLPVPTPAWSLGNIPMDSTSTTVTDSLPAGRYYWTVSIIDTFRNWSRSKEGSFQVQ